MIDVECWMVDSFRIQNCSFKISQLVRSVRFQRSIEVFRVQFSGVRRDSGRPPPRFAAPA